MLGLLKGSLLDMYKKKTFGIVLCPVMQDPEKYKGVVERIVDPELRTNLGSLNCLKPFVASDNFIRVRGRLCNSGLPEGEIHQIILPKKHPFTSP